MAAAGGSEPRPVTRSDVAARAGTSTAVVSYVVNNGPRPVAAETRERVLAAVTELGYRPNALARSLRAERTGLIGVLVARSDADLPGLLEGLQRAAADASVTVLLGLQDPNDPDLSARSVRGFIDHRVDGVVLAAQPLAPKVAAEIAAARTVSVEVLPLSDGTRKEALVDTRVAAELAVTHLAQHGCSRILPVAASAAEAERLDGLLAGAGLVHAVTPDGLEDILTGGSGPQALLCGSLDAALAAGAVVGRVAGDDGPLVAGLTHRLDDRVAEMAGLTTVAFPWPEVGARAVETLLARLGGDDAVPRPVHPLVMCRQGCRPPAIAGGGRVRSEAHAAEHLDG